MKSFLPDAKGLKERKVQFRVSAKYVNNEMNFKTTYKLRLLKLTDENSRTRPAQNFTLSSVQNI